MSLRLFLIITLQSFIVITTNLMADEQASKKIAQEIYFEFLSPFCPGRSLADCPSTKANELKEKILMELEQGQTKETILNNLEVEFGAEFNAKPRISGFASLAWLIPFGFMILILVGGYFWVKGNSRKSL